MVLNIAVYADDFFITVTITLDLISLSNPKYWYIIYSQALDTMFILRYFLSE